MPEPVEPFLEIIPGEGLETMRRAGQRVEHGLHAAQDADHVAKRQRSRYQPGGFLIFRPVEAQHQRQRIGIHVLGPIVLPVERFERAESPRRRRFMIFAMHFDYNPHGYRRAVGAGGENRTRTNRYHGDHTMQEHSRVGDKIRQLREAQEMSIGDLAKLSQSSEEMIEQLESGKLVPSVAPLLRIARGLGVRLGTFLDDEPHTGAVVVRAGSSDNVVRFSGIRAASNMSSIDFFSLSANKKDRHMEPFLVDVHPTVSEDCMLSAHEGEEFLYVLTGAIEVTYGKDLHTLTVGDSIYYDSVVPHEVRAANEEDARILAVIYTPV